MMDKQAYKKYLTEKRKTPQLIEERMKFLDELQVHLKQITTEEVSAFVNQRGLTSKQNAYKFLADYSAYITKKAPELQNLSSVIDKYCYQTFSRTASQAALLRKQAIVPIPANVTIAPKHLGKLTNTQFIHAFGTLQNCLIKIYDDVAQHPFEWGYPDFYIPDPHRTYNRVAEVLFAFVQCGLHEDGMLVVDAKKFFEKMKLHKKIEVLIAGLKKMEFGIEGFDKKAESFYVTYPENPHVITVLYVYVNATHEIQPQIRINPRISLSYRFLEDTSEKYEPEFLAAMDCASEKLYNIQMWLYEEAAKCGYHIDTSDPMEACGDAFGALRWGIGCVVYKKSPTKNARRFLVVGDFEKDGKKSVFARVVFNDTLHFENEMVKKLRSRFPKAFSFYYCGCIHPCNYSHRTSFNAEDNMQYENCSSSGTWFEDINLDDAKDILALFKFDKRIK